MANRDSDDDKKGRKRDFNISDDAFESDDGRDFMSDDEFEAFVNPSQNKRPGLPGKTKPKDFSRHEVKVRCSLVWLQNLNQWRLPNLFYPPSQCFSRVLDADNLSYGLKGLLI
jgi:hypothetical protein